MSIQHFDEIADILNLRVELDPRDSISDWSAIVVSFSEDDEFAAILASGTDKEQTQKAMGFFIFGRTDAGYVQEAAISLPIPIDDDVKYRIIFDEGEQVIAVETIGLLHGDPVSMDIRQFDKVDGLWNREITQSDLSGKHFDPPIPVVLEQPKVRPFGEPLADG